MKNFLRCCACFVVSSSVSFQIFAQAPTLGTAANFSLFTTAGAIGNTGISQITGDVGTNTGAVTGFGNVNGVMQTPPNGATGQAAIDLNNALAQINSASPVNTIAPALGGGQILFAGVYHVAGVASLNGDLILDAQNNSAAVFIFQLDQAFSSGFGAKVKLINGAQACNVFWRANGLISLGDETNMKGNVIANNDAFSLGVHDTLEGRAFSINGAITLNSVMAYTPTGCNAPVLTGPPAPSIGTILQCYAAFTKIGDITNTGNTFVTGDIGSNAGTSGGYDQLKVNGVIHPSPDASTGAASSNLTTLFNNLNLQAADITLLYPAQFGNELVLTPHTYNMSSAASLTGNIYLNAQGLPDAVFIIQINGALTAASLSRVVLVNGTKAKNVFWLVKGAATFGTNAVFNGTIVATGAISTATNDSINGRLFTTVGAITTQESVVTGSPGGCSVLPLSWMSFSGTPMKNTAWLQWETEAEANNSFFTLEKSNDGFAFAPLVSVTALAGSTPRHQYSYTDDKPFNIGYYRISHTDISGHRSYYRTIQVKFDNPEVGKLTTFVQAGEVFVQTSGVSAGPAVMMIYNMDGRKISSQTITIQPGRNTYKTVSPRQAGVYIVKIVGGEGMIQTGKVIVM